MQAPRRFALREAMAAHAAARALATLSDLDQALAGHALERPRAFLSAFATEHRIAGWESPAALAPYRQLPERLPLEAVPLISRVLFDSARAGRGELLSRAAWCFDDLDLIALGEEIERGATIEAAWTRHQRARIVAALVDPEDPERAQVVTEAHGQAWLAGGDPIDAETLALLEAFRAVAIIPASNAPEHARWMVRWLLRDHPDVDALAADAFWIAWFVDILRRAADGAIAACSARLEAAFSSENPDPLFAAVRAAGIEALDWPWVRRAVSAWRAAGARELLLGVGRALGATEGRGRTASAQTSQVARLRPIAQGFFRAARKDKRAPLPAELVEAGIEEHAARKLAHLPAATAADELLADHFGIEPRSVKAAADRRKNRHR